MPLLASEELKCAGLVLQSILTIKNPQYWINLSLVKAWAKYKVHVRVGSAACASMSQEQHADLNPFAILGVPVSADDGDIDVDDVTSRCLFTSILSKRLTS